MWHSYSVHPYAADPFSGLPVDSRAFRQRAPHIWLSDDPDTATAQTVQEMCRQIHQAAKDPLVRQLAINAVRNFRGGPAWAGTGINPFSNPQCMAESCWWWCKHFLRFKHHGSMFEAWSADLGDPRTKLQLLIAPDVLVRMNRMEGDCAIYTMMLCAMLEALGIRREIVTLVWIKCNLKSFRTSSRGPCFRPAGNCSMLRMVRTQGGKRQHGTFIGNGHSIRTAGAFRAAGDSLDCTDIAVVWAWAMSALWAIRTRLQLLRVTSRESRSTVGIAGSQWTIHRLHRRVLQRAGVHSSVPIELRTVGHVRDECAEGGSNACGDQRDSAWHGGRREWSDPSAESRLCICTPTGR